jgi:hypothetical protein
MGIIIVKTLQSHSPRPPIAPLRGPTHTRPGNLDLFFMKNCGVRGLGSHGNTAKLIWTMMEKKPQEDAKEERVVHTA